MTPEKVKSVFQNYRENICGYALLSAPIEPKQLNSDLYECFNVDPISHLQHVLWMCIEAQSLVDQGRIEKAMRWLGFVQGFMWALDLRTLESLKNDSKPAEDA